MQITHTLRHTRTNHLFKAIPINTILPGELQPLGGFFLCVRSFIFEFNEEAAKREKELESRKNKEENKDSRRKAHARKECRKEELEEEKETQASQIKRFN